MAPDRGGACLAGLLQRVEERGAEQREIREAAARRVREDKVRRLSAAARDRYADLLDRLGQ